MSSRYTALTDLGGTAVTHRDKMEEVKRQLGITHGYFDAWMYGFLENKKFNIEETVAKLHRRFAMEINELSTIEMTDFMKESLRKGIIQEIGVDKLGRVVFYVYTKRDVPQSKYREQQRKTFDMFVNYGTRLRKENKRCQLVMLINQEGAGLFKNVDMTFQADVALRISKFYPGGVDKMYIVNMSRTLAAMAKPIFKRLPSIVSDRIQIIDETDIKEGVLLDLFDASVLPVELGGENHCDESSHWSAYADRVETYFSSIKRALTDRGLTVKEAELELIGIDPRDVNKYPPDMSHPDASALLDRTVSTAHSTKKGSFYYDELKTLVTCLSDGGMEMEIENHRPDCEGEVSWQQVMGPIPNTLALFFLEELLRWRTEIEDQETQERYRLVDRRVADDEDAVVNTRGLHVDDNKWYIGVPYPLRALLRLILTGVTVLNAIYFMGALVFFAVFSANLVMTTFFGFFVAPSYFFPLNCVIMMVMIQAAAICTRAADIIAAIYQQTVIPPFVRLGSTLGTICEVVLFVIIVLIQLIIFCVYAARDCPLRGLQVAFATGWMSAMLIVGFTHVFFFTGVFTSRKKKSNAEGNHESGLTALPFFLALNFGGTRTDYKNAEKYLIRTSSFVICGIPLGVSMLLGIGFFISRIVDLYVCTIVAALTAAFAVNYYSEALTNSLSGSYMRITLWMMTVAWLHATFAFGFQNYEKYWGASVIVSTVLTGAFVLSAFACLNRRGNSWLLRLCFICLLLYLVGCWIAAFPVVGYRIGLFCLALMVHNALNVVLAPRDMSSIGAVFLVSAAVLLLSISAVLLGWYGTTLQYSHPRATPSTAPPASSALTPLELYHRYPVCTLTVGDSADLFTITDLSLLAEVVTARSQRVFSADFNTWFQGRDIVYDGVVHAFKSDGVSWDMHSFTAATAKTTFLLLTNKYAMSSMIAIVAWIDSIALSPLSIFLPWDWTETFVYVMSFMTKMIGYEWRSLIDNLTHYLEVIAPASAAGNTIIISGTGVAGGVASISAAQSGTQAIVFAAPGLLHLLRKVDITVEQYHTNVLAVGAYYGVLDNIGGQDVTIKQKIMCDGSAKGCISQTKISKELLQACGDKAGRKHS